MRGGPGGEALGVGMGTVLVACLLLLVELRSEWARGAQRIRGLRCWLSEEGRTSGRDRAARVALGWRLWAWGSQRQRCPDLVGKRRDEGEAAETRPVVPQLRTWLSLSSAGRLADQSAQRAQVGEEVGELDVSLVVVEPVGLQPLEAHHLQLAVAALGEVAP